MNDQDTIISLATPPGKGGIGILRISGKLVKKISKKFLKKKLFPRQAKYLFFFNKKDIPLDKGIALFFPKPHSFTGEDILELHGHGNPIILDTLLKDILSIKGVRLANPGEFLQRAFINEKIDLLQAESVADLINANSINAANAALESLNGKFSKIIRNILKKIINIRIFLESVINFPEEKIKILSKIELKESLFKINNELISLIKFTYNGKILRDGIKIVIAGETNVGKSSLINILSGYKLAIVTPIAGTTRDNLHENIYIDGIPIHIIDTAGLRYTENEIEKIGIYYSKKAISKANYILLVTECNTTSINEIKKINPFFTSKLLKNKFVVIIRNKSDLTNEPIGIKKIKNQYYITISIKLKLGINILKNFIKEKIGKFYNNSEGIILARNRHIKEIKNAHKYILNAIKLIHNYPYELIAEELKLSELCLNRIIGKYNTNDLLKKIFSKFCIGK